jgi:hypothetical protein
MIGATILEKIDSYLEMMGLEQRCSLMSSQSMILDGDVGEGKGGEVPFTTPPQYTDL